MSAIDILLIIAGVGYLFARRMIGQLLEIKSLLVLPVVLTGIGVSDVAHLHHVDAASVAVLAVSVAVSVALGVVRGRTVHLGVRDGALWMRYRVSSVLLWVLNIALKGALLPVAHAVSPHAAPVVGHGLLLAIGLGILAESAVVLVRAMPTDAAVAWEKGEEGTPPSSSPGFERARARVREAGSPAAAAKRLRVAERDW